MPNMPKKGLAHHNKVDGRAFAVHSQCNWAKEMVMLRRWEEGGATKEGTTVSAAVAAAAKRRRNVQGVARGDIKQQSA